MGFSPDEIAIYFVEGGLITAVAALGLAVTAIMLGSACHILWALPRGLVRRSAVALAVLGFEAPFLYLAGVESDVSFGAFAGAVALGLIGFVLATWFALALRGLGGLLVRLAREICRVGKQVGKAGNGQSSGRFAMLRRNEPKHEDNNPEDKEAPEPIFGPGAPEFLVWLILHALLRR
jgi:hypothetical protein